MQGLDFAPAVPYYSGGHGANAAAMASLRGTGQPVDVVVTNWCTSTSCTTQGRISVCSWGTAMGTFQTAVVYSSGGIFCRRNRNSRCERRRNPRPGGCGLWR